MADVTSAVEATTDTTAQTTETTTSDTLLADAGSTTNSKAGEVAATPAGDVKAAAEDTAKDGAAKSEDANGDKEDGDDKAEPIEYDLKIAEGLVVDEAAFGSFKEMAAKMNGGKGLSQEDAQAIVDFRAEMVKNDLAQWETTFSEWRGEINTDKDVGGDKLKSTTIPNVLAAAEKYGSPEMIQLLKTNKLYGENPHLLRLLNRVGATLREPSVERGKSVAPSKDKVSILYPNADKE